MPFSGGKQGFFVSNNQKTKPKQKQNNKNNKNK